MFTSYETDVVAGIEGYERTERATRVATTQLQKRYNRDFRQSTAASALDNVRQGDADWARRYAKLAVRFAIRVGMETSSVWIIKHRGTK